MPRILIKLRNKIVSLFYIIKNKFIRSRYFKILFLYSEKKNKLKSYKDIHKNNRCFIIGNGPSLNSNDLDLLNYNKEITFASNRIYNIFDSTSWRPTYYCIQDFILINEKRNEISKLDYLEKFIPINAKWLYNLNFKNSNYFYLNTERYFPNLPKFSEDISIEINEGFTVTYAAIQIAVYMGFKEIYLLGIDHNYSVQVNNNGEIIENKNVKDYFSNDNNNNMNLPNLQNSTLAYQKAKEYTDKKGVKIYNATRGGKLEVFERVNFDDLFNRKNKN